MTPPMTVVQIQMTLDQLLDAVRQLDTSGRAQVAQVLLESNPDAKFEAFLRRIAEGEPADDITDEMINEEIRAVRQAH